MKFVHVAAGIIRRADQIMLVEQVIDGMRYWSLPGGAVEPGETAPEGLVREVREEAGLAVSGLAGLSYVTEIRSIDAVVMACVFDIAGWTPIPEALLPGDPSGEVVAAEFVTVPVALERLTLLPWPAMAQPIVEHLTGAGIPYYTYVMDGTEQRRAENLFTKARI